MIEEPKRFTPEPFQGDPNSTPRFPMQLEISYDDPAFPEYRLRTEGGAINGTFRLGEEGDPGYGSPKGKEVELGEVRVDEERRGQGIGTELQRVFALEMAARGVAGLRAQVVSPTAMRNLTRVFGPGKTQFYERTLFVPNSEAHDMDRGSFIPVTDAEAAASLERSEARSRIRDELLDIRGHVGQEGYRRDDIGWDTQVDLTDPGVIRRLKQPLGPPTAEERKRIKLPDDNRHYPQEWDKELASLTAAERVQYEPDPSDQSRSHRRRGFWPWRARKSQ